MTRRLLHDIHAHLRQSRFAGSKPAQPLPKKTYDRMRQVPLMPLSTLSQSLADALDGRTSSRHPSSASLSFSSLSQILGRALKETRARRSYPSGGGYYPIEVYVLVDRVESLQRGVYHYRSDTNALEFLLKTEDSPVSRTISQDDLRDAPAAVVLTANCTRSATKYGDFALMLAYMEAGHVMQSLHLVATALGVGACASGGFFDTAVVELLDLPPKDEFPVYCTILSAPSDQ